jgi:formylglycine-generating enzyme
VVGTGMSLAAFACSDSGSGSSSSGGSSGGSSGTTSSSGGDGSILGPDGEVLFDGSVPTDGPTVNPGGSCAGLAQTCGGNKDCCAANAVPGGTFNRSNEAAYPATVSDFKLDVYEVTVARFRNYVNSGRGTQGTPPNAGEGAHPKIANSGWDPAWNAQLPTDTAEFRTLLKCNPDYILFTDTPGANENKPINCVTWFDAFAFCAWDGGRLPTETEWNYAAAGGSEQREYPWGTGIDLTRANYDCRGDGSQAGQCAISDVLNVGSKSPAGDGRWGHADLAGNGWEWTLDYGRTPYRLTTCNDCADLQGGVPNRTFRGGGFPNENYYLVTGARIDDVPTDRDYDVGLRCARQP